jgi:hypothetical protein
MTVKRQKALVIRRITLLTEADRQILRAETEVQAKQSSPCTVTITYGSVKYICQFPWPLEGQASIIRIARKSGWIEASAPMTVPKDPHSGYSLTPLTKEADALCSWNLPLINFKQLPRLDDSDPMLIKCLKTHHEQVLTDTEFENLENPNTLLQFKLSMVGMFNTASKILPGQKRSVFGIAREGQMRIILFVAGLYMDAPSHSVVADV